MSCLVLFKLRFDLGALHVLRNTIYNITINEVGKSKQNKTLLRYKESKDRQHVSALLFYKAIIRSDMMN